MRAAGVAFICVLVAAEYGKAIVMATARRRVEKGGSACLFALGFGLALDEISEIRAAFYVLKNSGRIVCSGHAYSLADF
jgi:hypothetical protein